MKSGKIIALISAVVILGIGTVFVLTKLPDKNNGDSVVDSAGSVSGSQAVKLNNKTYDENNIGELYYSPIDKDHVAEDESGIMYSDNEILLVSNDGVPKADIEKLAEEYNAEIVGYIEQTGDYQLKLSEEYTLDELDKLAEDIQNEDIVSSAYANYICEMSEDSVDDIKVGDEWENEFLKGINFLNGKVNLSSDDKMWGAKAINAPQAWYAMELLKENINPVKVGLIDNAFDENHVDLGFAKDGIFYDAGNNRKTIDVKPGGEGHGTHVAGTMAARGDNEEGICGIYPYANNNLYAVSTTGLQKYSENSSFYKSMMIYKIGYAELILRNVKVINQSQGFNWESNWEPQENKNGEKFLGYKHFFNTEESWNEYQSKLYNDSSFRQKYTELSKSLSDFFNRMLDKGYDFVIVCSAGNDSNNTIGNIESKYNSWVTLISDDEDRKEIYDRIIVVGSVNTKFDISVFSNAGTRTDIYAPGEKIFSTTPNGEYQNHFKEDDGNVQEWSGTSMASPHVAGVCADVWSMNNYLTGAEVKEIVCNSTIDNVVAYTYTDDKGNTHDKGVVDANKAVAEAYNRLATSGRVKKEPENGAILGWVVEKDNKDNKIKEATVTATVKDADDGEIYSAKTDEYGHFELILPKGDYTLTVQDKDKKYKKFTVDVKDIKNGEVLYLDYWIELEKKLTKAEKYAQIVMDNEDVWLNGIKDLNGYGSKVDCWFQDLDLDGTPEFIVGGFLSGAHAACTFLVYRLDDNGMTPLTDIATSEYLNFWNCTEINCGYDGFILKLYKNEKTDEFIYVNSSIDGVYNETYYCYEKRNCNLSEILKYQTLGMCTVHYDDNSNIYYTYTDATGAEVSQDEFINEYDDFFYNLTPYIVNVKPIYCYSPDNKKYYFENLEKSEKQKLLIESFKTFSYKKEDSLKKPLEDFVNEQREISSQVSTKVIFAQDLIHNNFGVLKNDYFNDSYNTEIISAGQYNIVGVFNNETLPYIKIGFNYQEISQVKDSDLPKTVEVGEGGSINDSVKIGMTYNELKEKLHFKGAQLNGGSFGLGVYVELDGEEWFIQFDVPENESEKIYDQAFSDVNNSPFSAIFDLSDFNPKSITGVYTKK